MKTPIPEKIDSKYTADYGFLVDYINSLIDVVTEQQKKIDFLNDWRIEHIDEHLNLKPTEEDIDKFVDYSINKYGKTYKALGKSQEDIREKIAKYLFYEVWVKQNIVWEKQVFGVKDEWYEKADRILAIVKGE